MSSSRAAVRGGKILCFYRELLETRRLWSFHRVRRHKRGRLHFGIDDKSVLLVSLWRVLGQWIVNHHGVCGSCSKMEKSRNQDREQLGSTKKSKSKQKRTAIASYVPLLPRSYEARLKPPTLRVEAVLAPENSRRCKLALV